MKHGIVEEEVPQSSKSLDPDYVYDGNNTYKIESSRLGELIITSINGRLRIEPTSSNQIILFTENETDM